MDQEKSSYLPTAKYSPISMFIVGIGMLLIGLFAGYLLFGNKAVVYNNTQEPTPSTGQKVSLVPADSQTPSASSCLSSTTSVIKITLPPDFVPVPRCTKVTASQSLLIINNSGKTISGKLGQYTIDIPSGQQQAISTEFGSYLASGVHRIPSGAEIWLQP